MTDFAVKRGETGPTIEVYSESMDSIAGWTCVMTLRGPDGTPIIDERSITETNEDGDRFVAYLTAVELGSLDLEIYTWEFVLANSTETPPFVAQELHRIFLEPPSQGFSNQAIIKGVNSFGTYEELLAELATMPMLNAANNATRVNLKVCAIQAWRNVGGLNVDFENDLSSTIDFTEEVIDALLPHQSKQLIQAQLIEADFLLGGNPVETRRRMGLMSDSVGESAHFMRPSKPLVLSVCRDAALALTPYVRYTASTGRA